jgi:hypothetical protein
MLKRLNLTKERGPKWIRLMLGGSQIAVLIGGLLLVGSSWAAQGAASEDVYVAPRRFYAQKLVEEVRARHPELIYLNLRTIPPGRKDSFKVASSPPSRGGGEIRSG